MKNIVNFKTILIFSLVILVSCNSSKKPKEPVWSDLPKSIPLDSLKQTDFVLTLETPISENKNVVYVPSFLYLWDELKKEIGEPFIDQSNSKDFQFLNRSISHHNSLADSEYTAYSKILNGEIIIAKAFFHKALPFPTPFQVLDSPVLFDKKWVNAFGMQYFNEELTYISKLIYYKDDDHFIIKLLPKDEQHEIILAKGLDKYQTLGQGLALTNELIEKGKQEKNNSASRWKYKIDHEDKLAIPIIKFNIDTHLESLMGQTIFAKGHKSYLIDTAYQRIGFILNEIGAVVEGESSATAAKDSAEQIRHPKKMVFNKPFLIIIKRKNQVNPYFVMKVDNAELLTKKNNSN